MHEERTHLEVRRQQTRRIHQPVLAQLVNCMVGDESLHDLLSLKLATVHVLLACWIDGVVLQEELAEALE